MDHSGRLQLVAPLVMVVVSLFLMAASLHTAVNAQELTLISNCLGGVASYEPRGFDSSAGHICDGTLEEEFMMASEAHGRLLRRVRYYTSYGALASVWEVLLRSELLQDKQGLSDLS